MKTFTALLLVLFLFVSHVPAQDAKTIKLHAPEITTGKPLMQALKARASARSFDSKPLSQQELSNILWAAYGINRAESGKRTAPSAKNWQEISVYVILQEGAYIYDAKENVLKEILKEDIRSLAGMQDYAKTAPLNLIFVSDQSKMDKSSAEDKWLLSGADAAFAIENVYLYCASQDLAVVVRAMIDKPALAKKLGLPAEQKIILGQTIGYKGK